MIYNKLLFFIILRVIDRQKEYVLKKINNSTNTGDWIYLAKDRER
jgi:hypothetical protein